MEIRTCKVSQLLNTTHTVKGFSEIWYKVGLSIDSGRSTNTNLEQSDSVRVWHHLTIMMN